jgi:hypothetical protein
MPPENIPRVRRHHRGAKDSDARNDRMSGHKSEMIRRICEFVSSLAGKSKNECVLCQPFSEYPTAQKSNDDPITPHELR